MADPYADYSDAAPTQPAYGNPQLQPPQYTATPEGFHSGYTQQNTGQAYAPQVQPPRQQWQQPPPQQMLHPQYYQGGYSSPPPQLPSRPHPQWQQQQPQSIEMQQWPIQQHQPPQLQPQYNGFTPGQYGGPPISAQTPMQPPQQFVHGSTPVKETPYSGPKSVEPPKRRRGLIIALVITVLAVVVVIAVVVPVEVLKSKSSSASSFTVMGNVTSYVSGLAVSGVTVGGGACTSSTSSSVGGAYSVTCTTSASSVVVDVSPNSPYVPTHVAVPLSAGLIAYAVPIQLNQFGSQTSFQPSTGTQVTVTASGRSVALSVPALTASQMQSVNAPNTAQFRVAVIPAANSPGMMQSAQANANDGSVALQTAGMFYFDLWDPTSGTAWSLPSGVSASVSMQGTPSLPSITNNSLQWFAFASDAGLWTQSGSMQPMSVHSESEDGLPPQHRMSIMSHVEGSSPNAAEREHEMRLWQTGTVAAAPSVGYWNSDRNYLTACVIGTLQAPSGSSGACAGCTVTATGPDSISSHGSSDTGGSFCVEGAQTFQSTLSIGGGQTTTVQMPANPGTCANPSSCAKLSTPITVRSSSNCPSQTPPSSPSGGDSQQCDNALQSWYTNWISVYDSCTSSSNPEACCGEITTADSQLISILDGVCTGVVPQAEVDAWQSEIQELQTYC